MDKHQLPQAIQTACDRIGTRPRRFFGACGLHADTFSKWEKDPETISRASLLVLADGIGRAVERLIDLQQQARELYEQEYAQAKPAPAPHVNGGGA
jgi:hypothetical protein